jgi:hypothetical protein
MSKKPAPAHTPTQKPTQTPTKKPVQKQVRWVEDDDDDSNDDMPGLDDLEETPKNEEFTLEDIFDDLDDEETRNAKANAAGVFSKPINERNIVVSDYKLSNPYSQIMRDHFKELDEFWAEDRTRNLDTFLMSCKVAKFVQTPTFLIQSMHSMGLVASHLQHQKLAADCIVVDVLIRNLGKIEDVNMSTTVYLVFEPVSGGDQKPMDTECILVNYIFDLRRVTIEETVLGKIGDVVNK